MAERSTCVVEAVVLDSVIRENRSGVRLLDLTVRTLDTLAGSCDLEGAHVVRWSQGFRSVAELEGQPVLMFLEPAPDVENEFRLVSGTSSFYRATLGAAYTSEMVPLYDLACTGQRTL